MHPHAGLEGLAVGVEAREGRQQAGVDVEEAAGVAGDEGVGEHAHEAGQHHQVGAVGVDGIGQGRVEGLAAGVGLVVNHLGDDALVDGKGEALGVGAVGDDGGDFGAGDLRPDDGLHVAAAAGDEDDEFFHAELLNSPPAPAGS